MTDTKVCPDCGRAKVPVNLCDDEIREDGQCPSLTIDRLRAELETVTKERDELLRKVAEKPAYLYVKSV